MPLGVRGRTRATLKAWLSPWSDRIGKPVESPSWQGFGLEIVPHERGIPSNASHKLALITSLPFVHTARRCYRVNGLARASEGGAVGREDARTWSFRGSKSRNKVSVGEPAEGSLLSLGDPNRPSTMVISPGWTSSNLAQLVSSVGPPPENCDYGVLGLLGDVALSQSSGAVWTSSWPSWAPCPNEPYGLCGRKATVNREHALVTVCQPDIRGH